MDHLREAFRRILRHPIVLLIPLPGALAAAIGAIAMGSAFRGGPVEQQAALFVVAGLALVALSPGVASGFNVVVGAVARDLEASWRTFAAGFGTYYGKIFVAALAWGICFTAIGRFFVSSAPRLSNLLSIALGLVGDLAAHLWFAALVLEGCGGLKAVRLGWVAFSRHAREFALPALAMAAVDGGLSLAGSLSGGWAGLPAAALLEAVIGAAATGWLRLAFFLAYDRASHLELPAEIPAGPAAETPALTR